MSKEHKQRLTSAVGYFENEPNSIWTFFPEQLLIEEGCLFDFAENILWCRAYNENKKVQRVLIGRLIDKMTEIEEDLLIPHYLIEKQLLIERWLPESFYGEHTAFSLVDIKRNPLVFVKEEENIGIEQSLRIYSALNNLSDRMWRDILVRLTDGRLARKFLEKFNIKNVSHNLIDINSLPV